MNGASQWSKNLPQILCFCDALGGTHFFTKHRDLVQSLIYSWFSKNKTSFFMHDSRYVLGVKGHTFTPPNTSLSLCPNTHRSVLQRAFLCAWNKFLLLGRLQNTLDCVHLNSSVFKSFTDLQVCWFLFDPWPVFSHQQVMVCFLSGHGSTVSYILLYKPLSELLKLELCWP